MRLLLGVGLVTLIWIGSSLAVTWTFTRRAGAWRAEPMPELAWASISELRLTASDGVELGAWMIAEEEPGGSSVILLHGNGATRRTTLPQARLYAGAGCVVLALTLRCHGDSGGEVNDFGRSAAHDVVAAVEHLERARPGRPIVVHGISLGAAAGIFAAARLEGRVAGWVFECPYRDLRTAIRNRTSIYLPPILDSIAYAGLVAATSVSLDMPEGIAPVNRIADIPGNQPVLLLAGRQDRRATLAEVEELRDRVKGPARLVVFDEAGHVDLQERQPGLYTTTIERFLDEVEAAVR